MQHNTHMYTLGVGNLSYTPVRGGERTALMHQGTGESVNVYLFNRTTGSGNTDKWEHLYSKEAGCNPVV